MSYGYEKEKENGRKIVNGNFEVIDKIGEGSFWKVYKVERSVFDESNNHRSFHVFKEGKLSFLSQEDENIEQDAINDEDHDEISINNIYKRDKKILVIEQKVTIIKLNLREYSILIFFIPMKISKMVIISIV